MIKLIKLSLKVNWPISRPFFRLKILEIDRSSFRHNSQVWRLHEFFSMKEPKKLRENNLKRDSNLATFLKRFQLNWPFCQTCYCFYKICIQSLEILSDVWFWVLWLEVGNQSVLQQWREEPLKGAKIFSAG